MSYTGYFIWLTFPDNALLGRLHEMYGGYPKMLQYNGGLLFLRYQKDITDIDEDGLVLMLVV